MSVPRYCVYKPQSVQLVFVGSTRYVRVFPAVSSVDVPCVWIVLIKDCARYSLFPSFLANPECDTFTKIKLIVNYLYIFNLFGGRS